MTNPGYPPQVIPGASGTEEYFTTTFIFLDNFTSTFNSPAAVRSLTGSVNTQALPFRQYCATLCRHLC